MAERTFKTAGWQAQARPAEGRELIESRQLIREVIFSLYREKAELLAKMGMPSQPIHLSQIFKEIESRIALRRSLVAGRIRITRSGGGIGELTKPLVQPTMRMVCPRLCPPPRACTCQIPFYSLKQPWRFQRDL